MIISGDRTISYPDIHARAARAATGLKELGLAFGTPVALMLRNDFALFEASVAASTLGSPVVPINWHLKAEGVNYILADCGAGILVCHADLWPQIRDGVPAHIRVLIVATPPEIAAAFGVLPEAAAVPSGMTDWDQWRDARAPWAGPPGRVSPMFYTSGTTGKPKGVRRGQSRPEQQAALERVSTLTYGIKPDDNQVVLMNGPMYHSAPSSYGMLAFRHGCTIVLEPALRSRGPVATGREARHHPHACRAHHVRATAAAAGRGSQALRRLLAALHHPWRSPLPGQRQAAMIDWWGLVINEYLGSTETGIPVWHSAAEALKKPGTVGRAIEGGIVKIFRPDGTLCDVGEPGEIFMRQTAISDFDYHGNAAARAEAGRDGLVSVGDVGYLDGDGYLFLCDRKRDMVISGGVNIYPAEIENALIGMDGVRDCAVFGVPDAEYGERLFACIEPEAAAGLSAAAVQSYLRSKLANFKVPKDIQFLDTLPREASGKIFKRKLRDLYGEGRLRPVA